MCEKQDAYKMICSFGKCFIRSPGKPPHSQKEKKRKNKANQAKESHQRAPAPGSMTARRLS